MMAFIKFRLTPILLILFMLVAHAWADEPQGACEVDWRPVVHTNSTTAYGIVTIDGAPASEGDKIAAFVGGECRAVGEVTLYQGDAYATLLIQGTETETVTFKIWDASECVILETDKTVQSAPGDKIGYPPNYISLDGALGEKPILSVSPTDKTVSAQSGEFTISISNNGGGELNWSGAVSEGDWLQIVGDGSGVNNGLMQISYDANSGNERAAIITVNAGEAENSPQSIVIVQTDSSAQGNTVTFVPSKNVVKIGETFSLEIRIKGDSIWAAHVNFIADPNLFQLRKRGNYGDFFNSRYRFDIAFKTDSTTGSWAGAESLKHPTEAASGEGLFAKNIELKVLPGSYGEVSITGDAILSGKMGDLLPTTLKGATITVDDGLHGGDGIISGVVSLIDGTPVENAEVTISINGVEHTTTTDENGNYQFEDLRDLDSGEEFKVEVTKDDFHTSATLDDVSNPVELNLEILNTALADLNKDGVVDIADFTLLANSYGISQGEDGFDLRADINADGRVDILDLALLGSHWKI